VNEKAVSFHATQIVVVFFFTNSPIAGRQMRLVRILQGRFDPILAETYP